MDCERGTRGPITPQRVPGGPLAPRGSPTAPSNGFSWMCPEGSPWPHRGGLPVVPSSPKEVSPFKRLSWSCPKGSSNTRYPSKGPRHPVSPKACPWSTKAPMAPSPTRGSAWLCPKRSSWSHRPPEGPHGLITHWSPQASVTPKKFPWTRRGPKWSPWPYPKGFPMVLSPLLELPWFQHPQKVPMVSSPNTGSPVALPHRVPNGWGQGDTKNRMAPGTEPRVLTEPNQHQVTVTPTVFIAEGQKPTEIRTLGTSEVTHWWLVPRPHPRPSSVLVAAFPSCQGGPAAGQWHPAARCAPVPVPPSGSPARGCVSATTTPT